MPTMVEEVSAKSVVRKGGVSLVGTYQLERNENGLNIKIKSEMLEKFFKGMSSRLEKDGAGRKYYNFKPGSSDNLSMTMDDGSQIYWEHSGDTIVSGKSIYLWFLRMEGIGSGLEINFPGLYSKPGMIQFTKSLKYAMAYLYTNYMKPYKVSCDINTIEYYHVDGQS